MAGKTTQELAAGYALRMVLGAAEENTALIPTPPNVTACPASPGFYLIGA
jgi:hypothetical protein